MFENIREDFQVYAHFTGVKRWPWPFSANWLFDFRRWMVALWMFPFSSVLLFRLKKWLKKYHVPILPRICDWINQIVWQVQIADNVEIGPGFCISHGLVLIGGEVKIGRHCTFNPYSGAGLAHKRVVGHPVERLIGPTLGDNVYVGGGGRMIGPIKIGNNVRIGANTLVVHDVPDDAVVVGNPPRLVDLKDPEQRILVQDVLD
jgi:serine O-acetyltransferase